MPPRERNTPTSQGDDNEEAEHRRSRLWLGSSAENLHDDGFVAQGNDRNQSQQDLVPSRTRDAPKAQNDGQGEDYTVPDDYENLDEVAAPSPVESPEKERAQGYLEDRKPKSTPGGGDDVPDDFDNLDEVAAPSPIASPQRDHTQGYLEDGNSSSTLGDVVAVPIAYKKLDGTSAAPLPKLEERSKADESSPQRQKVSKLATEVYTISYLIFFSIIGTLARLGLQALTFYPGAPVQTGLLWANVGGSLVMGFLLEDRKLFREGWNSSGEDSNDAEKGNMPRRTQSAKKKHAAVKKTIPLYIGLATGFCGSFTSFSSFIRDTFCALSNALPVPIQHPSSAPISQTVGVHRNPGYSFLALLAVLIVTIGLSLMALQFGAHVALFLEPYTPSIPALFGRRIVDRSIVFLAGGCWLAAMFMAIWPPDRPGGPVADATWTQETWRSQALFALVFAPVGCLLRFYASLHLNGRIKSFPLGTFAVNIFGTAMEAMFVDLQHVPIGGMVGCQVLQGMADGFCGCLTTVSTWVAELSGLRLRHAYVYGLMSVGVALSLFVIITGSLQWTIGFTHPLCTT